MKPGEVGKKLGIGMRVAGRIAKQRVEQGSQPTGAAQGLSSNRSPIPESGRLAAQKIAQQAQQVGRQAPKYSRAAGRGIGGFLRPFGRVGGILWLEVTGFFFGLFVLYFGIELWRTRLDYAQGPMHQRFLIALACTALFAYLSISAFWRARRR